MQYSSILGLLALAANVQGIIANPSSRSLKARSIALARHDDPEKLKADLSSCMRDASDNDDIKKCNAKHDKELAEACKKAKRSILLPRSQEGCEGKEGQTCFVYGTTPECPAKDEDRMG
ncbi:Uu.00g030060.m01.CDS01 [Anthostomella pinea]|uniref:Uu.00g030060.m01.CDS01 n=1 Tax=Anthostomella pinea TaxID=933095 RepID=A0AAI8V3D2_9PEZI|nr:Uu.00g030060.m01.CDS01 [Anthostomella pinea]